MKRWLVQFPVFLSLLLALAMGFVWVHSYTSQDQLVRTRLTQEGTIDTEFEQQLIASCGEVGLDCLVVKDVESQNNHIRPQDLNKVALRYMHRDQTERVWQLRATWLDRMGIGHLSISFPSLRAGFISAQEELWAVPCWLIMMILCAWPAILIGWWVLKRQRIKPGVCPACGYDLRATPDRCSECGRVPLA